MSDSRWQRLETLLDEMLDLAPGDRSARLEEIDNDWPEGAAAIRDALDVDRPEPGIDRLGALIEAACDAAPGDPGEDAEIPESIGAWRLVELIASGGMGDVFRARRDDGEFEATAALKRLRMHLTSARAHDRFRRERQVLADLRHPNIAALLDGGVDTQGVPYFVMELVDGLPVTEHCDQAKLSVDDRLRIFEQVVAAVAAAHSRLVVHRDLKPPNILVTDGGSAKLVDFGIAKLLDEPDDVGVTATHDRVLTPRYAAPEQVLGGEITTATDVYGLGAVLYELLSGCRTFTDEEIRRALLVGGGIPDPPRMSVALARATPDEAAAIARRRGATVAGLRRALRGDLDAIVAKALRPDPGDRYATVAALADDLRRARSSEPVTARRGSMPYRLGKLWARHRVSASALAVVAASLTIGLGVALNQARAARIAERRAAVINRFLTEELLGAADPRVARGREVTVSEILDRTGRTLGAAAEGAPEVEASLRRTLGEVWVRLGSFDRARAELETARRLAAGDAVATARVAMSIAELHHAEGDAAAARTLAERAVADLAAATGGHSLETLEARVRLGAIVDGDGDPIRAERILTGAMTDLDRRWSANPVLRAQARIELAAVLRHQGRRLEGIDHLRSALTLQRASLGNDHPDIARTLEELASMLSFMGWHGEAEVAARESVAVTRRVFGPAHWRSARAEFVLAKTLSYSDRTSEAFEVARAALESVLDDFGPTHPEVIDLRNALAVFSNRLGDAENATAYYREALRGAETGLGPAHDRTMTIRRNLSNHLAALGADGESLELARQVARYGAEAAGETQPDPMYLANTAYFLVKARLAEARDPVLALALARRAVEVSGGRWYYPLVTLSYAHDALGEPDAAIDALGRALALPDGLHYAGPERSLVEMLTRRGDLVGCERFLRSHLERRRQVRVGDDPLLGHTHGLLGRVLLAQGKAGEAAVELDRALTIFDAQLDADHPWWVPVLSDLGAAERALGRLDDAARHLARAEEVIRSDRFDGADAERRLLAARLADVTPGRRFEGASAATPAP